MRKVVVGVGNILWKDDGVGCHVARVLERMSVPDVAVVDGGTCPDALDLFGGVEKLVIVDAVKAGGLPGQIYRFRLDDLSLGPKSLLSFHDMSLADSLMVMRSRGEVVEAVVVGVEPKEIAWGLDLSPDIQEKIPQIIQVVLSELGATAEPAMAGKKGGE